VRNEPEAAEESLRRILGRDLVPSRQVSAQMKSEGYSDKAIRRAREHIGVIVRRTGFGKDMASYWKLPDGAFVPCDDIAAHSCPAKTWAGMGTRADSQGRNGCALAGDDQLEGLPEQ
jgi:putative DNA primase/helicase